MILDDGHDACAKAEEQLTFTAARIKQGDTANAMAHLNAAHDWVAAARFALIEAREDQKTVRQALEILKEF